jgi:photosystem II stability/assembly factor-like uncharacterized protein
MGDEILRRNLDDAFAVPSELPDPRLVSRTMAAIVVGGSRPLRRRVAVSLGLGLAATRLVAVAIILVLSLTVAGVFVALHRGPVPVVPTRAPVIFPTKMVSATTGWAVTGHGSSQQVWRTVTGGIDWTDVTPPPSANPAGYTYTNYFLDDSHAWVTESEASGAVTPYLVTYRTADGGKSWQRGTPLNTGIAFLPPTEQFINASAGWLVLANHDLAHAAWPEVYATTDAGMHWELMASQAGSGEMAANSLAGAADPSFVTTSTGWLTVDLYAPGGSGAFNFTQSTVLVTHDGGRTWRLQPLPLKPSVGTVVDAPVFFGSQGIMVLHPIDPAATLKSVLLSTTNSGTTWTARTLEWPYIGSIQFVDRQHGWALAGPGSDFMKGADKVALPLYRTNDGGVTWMRVTTSLNLVNGRDLVTDIHFVDRNTGFATIWNDTGPTQLLRSDDGGQTWTVVAVCKSALGNSYPPPVCSAKT